MDSATPNDRLQLTYPDLTYSRLLIYGSVCLLSYGIIFFSPQQPVNDHKGVAGWQIAVLILFPLSAFLTIFEGAFVFRLKLFSQRIEFDNDNLYITGKAGETVIPLGAVTCFRLLSMNRGVRGFYTRYLIEFSNEGSPDEISFSVYRRTSRSFARFQQLLREKYPAVEIRNRVLR